MVWGSSSSDEEAPRIYDFEASEEPTWSVNLTGNDADPKWQDIDRSVYESWIMPNSITLNENTVQTITLDFYAEWMNSYSCWTCSKLARKSASGLSAGYERVLKMVVMSLYNSDLRETLERAGHIVSSFNSFYLVIQFRLSRNSIQIISHFESKCEILQFKVQDKMLRRVR